MQNNINILFQNTKKYKNKILKNYKKNISTETINIMKLNIFRK